MASCARIPSICMVRADQLRKEEEEEEELLEVKEEMVDVEEEEEEEEEGVVMGLMFESAVLKAKVI